MIQLPRFLLYEQQLQVAYTQLRTKPPTDAKFQRRRETKIKSSRFAAT